MAAAHFKLRESIPPGRVLLYRNDEVVFQSRGYAVAATYAAARYNLSEATMEALYADYRADFDNR